MPVLETAVEAHLRDGVRRRGGLSFKLAPTTKGMPDRLVILPGCAPALVELKTDAGRLSPLQAELHRRIRALGTPVAVLYGKADVDSWLSAQQPATTG